jgi:hypothetical protein
MAMGHVNVMVAPPIPRLAVMIYPSPEAGFLTAVGKLTARSNVADGNGSLKPIGSVGTLTVMEVLEPSPITIVWQYVIVLRAIRQEPLPT